MVPEEGLEPSRGCPHRILSPARLPFHHSGTRTGELILITNSDLRFKSVSRLLKKTAYALALFRRGGGVSGSVFRVNSKRERRDSKLTYARLASGSF